MFIVFIKAHTLNMFQWSRLLCKIFRYINNNEKDEKIFKTPIDKTHFLYL